MAAGRQASFAEHAKHGVALVESHLDHGAQLFGEQRAQRLVVAALRHLLRPVLGVAVVLLLLRVQRQHVDVERHAAVAGKGHLGQRGHKAAV
ncbi:hypothetical protein D3C72_1291400 [compost metagenome]